MKVILAPATGECVLVSKKPQRVAPSSKQALGDKAAENKTRDVGVGDGDGVVNPEEPKVMVFDEQYRSYHILAVFLGYFRCSKTSL